jgi:hypothetical protein
MRTWPPEISAMSTLLTTVSCPTLPTIRDEVTVPALSAQFTVMSDCPGLFTVGGSILIPGRGVLRIEDVDVDLKAITVTNISVQANLTLLAGTKVHALPAMDQLWDAFLREVYAADPTDVLLGKSLLFFTEDGIKSIAPKLDHYLVGGPTEQPGGEYPYWQLRPLDELIETLAPGLSAGTLRVNRSVALGALTVAGSETITPSEKPEDVTIQTVWISATLRNAAAGAERTFSIGSRSWQVYRASYLHVHVPLAYNGIGTIAVVVPTDGSIHDMFITGYDVEATN